MIYFTSDYCESCHPKLLQAIVDLGDHQYPGYGKDEISAETRTMLKEQLDAPEAAIHFMVSGTQSNFILIAAALRPHEGVLCVETGHPNVHETGAVEATGHKLLILPPKEGPQDGKVDPELVDIFCEDHFNSASPEHQVKPKMIYISNTTELGTVYHKAELEALRKVADKWNLYLFMDGARLGSAMKAESQDLTMQDLPKLCDAFTIGGTKCGLAFGEAMVITNPAIQEDFRYIQKQKGAMLAKGWLIATQFRAAFKDSLFWELADHENKMSMRIAAAFAKAKATGVSFAYRPISNQLFIWIPNDLDDLLKKSFVYEYSDSQFEPNRKFTRWVTSFWTKEENVRALEETIDSYLATRS